MYGRASMESPELPLRGALVQIKGHWSEWCTSLGFPNWNTTAAPCIFCDCNKTNMLNFAALSLEGHAEWTLHDSAMYTKACESCEIHIRLEIGMEEARREICNDLNTVDKKSGIGGRVLKNGVPKFGLKANDRLEPSVGLPDPFKLEEQQLSCTILFWRRHMHRKMSGQSLTPLSTTIWINCGVPSGSSKNRYVAYVVSGHSSNLRT